MPILLIGFGVYLLRDYVFKPKETQQKWAEYGNGAPAQAFSGALSDVSFRSENFDAGSFETQTRCEIVKIASKF